MAGDERGRDSSKSIDTLKEDLRENPQELGNYLRLAWMFYAEGLYEEAMTTLQNANIKFSDDFEVVYLMGLISKKNGHMLEAKKIFQKVIQLSEKIADETRAMMLRRFAMGHANMIENGEWNFNREIW